MQSNDPENPARDGSKKGAGVELVSEPVEVPNDFNTELAQTLKETEQAISEQYPSLAANGAQSWTIAREVVQNFRPVPWFVWRLSNFVLGKPGQINPVSEGLVFGLRRLLFAAASDATLGSGMKVNNVRRALEVLEPDVVAAIAVIHAVCRRLSSYQFDRIWRPMLDDALLRSQIGLMVGQNQPSFGAGRGMLAGFAGRCGLTILLASGSLEQAREALEMLATGAEFREVGAKLFGCDPLQVSAMTLSAAGCGRDAAFGTVNYAAKVDLEKVVENEEQLRWLAAFTITESVRTGKLSELDPRLWEVFDLDPVSAAEELQNRVRTMVRRGHGWHWIV